MFPEPIRQENIHAYLGSGDLCVEIHLSKALFAPDDQKLFEEVLTTVRLLPHEAAVRTQSQPPAHDSSYYFRMGSQYYLLKEYPVAAEHYQKALDQEKQKRTLNADMFRVLVDNLAIAYGISGDLARSKQTLEYGITLDPKYPLFYYNLACGYGEMGKMEESLDQLRLAYKYKANMIAGEAFPDPLQDDSFRKFVNNRKFVDAVHAMQQ
jgi:tetratricopeptide (TPR) repeat protein